MDCIDCCIDNASAPGAGSGAGAGSGSEKPYHTVSASSFMKEGEPVHVMDIVHRQNIHTHIHDFYEFVCIERGFAIHNTSNGMSVLLPGDAILILPGEPHSYFNVHAQKLYNCLFKPEVFEGFDNILPCHKDDFLKILTKKIHIGMESREELFRLMKSMKTETNEHSPGWIVKIKAQLIEVLLLAYRNQLKRGNIDKSGNDSEYDNSLYEKSTGAQQQMQQPPQPQQQPQQPQQPPHSSQQQAPYGYISTGIVMMAIDYMQKEYHNGINMQDVAAVCNVTPDYLAKLFRKACGIAPSEFLSSLRISTAMDLLQNSGMSVADIALKVGYDDAAYFARSFKKAVGISPSTYRTGINIAGI